jgi:hypothetical protein
MEDTMMEVQSSSAAPPTKKKKPAKAATLKALGLGQLTAKTVTTAEAEKIKQRGPAACISMRGWLVVVKMTCKHVKNPPTQHQQHHRLFIDCPHVADDDAFNAKCTIENVLRHSMSSSFRHNILSLNGDPDDRLQVDEDNITELADLGGRSASSAGVPSDSVTNDLMLSALTSNQATGSQLGGLGQSTCTCTHTTLYISGFNSGSAPGVFCARFNDHAPGVFCLWHSAAPCTGHARVWCTHNVMHQWL